MSGFPLRELNIYPIKSCRALALTKMSISMAGPVGDRQWMLVDEQGVFLSQRKWPKLASIEVHFDGKTLSVGIGKQFFVVPFSSNISRPISAKIWEDIVEAALEPDLFSQAFAQYLGIPCRLARYTDRSQRRLPSADREDWKPEVRFSDSRPLSLINLKSLELLNSHLGDKAVPVNRFRGNVVFEGSEAFAEDQWQRIRLGSVVFSNPKKCSRCQMININQQDGVVQGPEPLKTLAGFRRDGNKVPFGMLWIPENAGEISLEDRIEVLE